MNFLDRRFTPFGVSLEGSPEGSVEGSGAAAEFVCGHTPCTLANYVTHLKNQKTRILERWPCESVRTTEACTWPATAAADSTGTL